MKVSVGRMVRWLVVVAAAALFVLAASAEWITELWWFQELGYESVFWTRQLWPWGIRLGLGLLLAALLYANFIYAGQSLRPLLFRFQHRWPRLVRRGPRVLAVVTSLLLGMLASSAVAPLWEWVARYVYRVPFGRVDPLMGQDLGFFLFELPFFRLLHSTATMTLVFALLTVAALYALAGVLALDGLRLYVDPRPRRHLLTLAAAFFFLKAADYRLQQFELVNSQRGVIFGASYTDAHVVLPLLWVMMGLSVLAALVLLRSARGPGLGRPALAVGAVLVASLVLLQGLPELVQRFVVEPNELERERPFIERAIQFTRFGYDLDRIEEREFPLKNDLDAEALVRHQGTLSNVRLWDWRPMLTSFRQLQEIRFYYRFSDVDVARYRINGQLRQVMTAVREFDISQIHNRTWINEHLQYTHGYGLVASPVNESTPEGLPLFWLRDIPPRSDVPELAVEVPQVYFGEMTESYALVGTRVPEFDYPLGEDNAWTRYSGRGGIPVGSWPRRALFALRTGTYAFLFSRNFTPETRILMRRQIGERVRAIAPFVRFDQDPYAVVVDGRLFWIIDGYTTASGLPYSQPTRGWGNYVRNSVKAVVDAYHGDVTFYAADEEDPVLQVYRRIYPGLFAPLSEMPEGLRAHLRYPEDFFLLQARMYSLYHMTSPVIFYNQEDVWHIAREIYRGQEQEMSPYYTILQLPDGDEPEMVLMLPFTPARRNNMIAWLAARNDGEHYGRLVVFQFPKDQLVFGPMQIEARIDQDPAISEVLTLWDQAGSQVIRGNLLVLPLDNSLLYVKPIFLRAETGELPELVRVIVAFGPRLVMRPTLEEALAALFPPQPSPAARGEPEPDLPQESLEGIERPGESSGLAREAWRHWQAAQEALKAGDWAAYGAALQRLEAVLRQMAFGGH